MEPTIVAEASSSLLTYLFTIFGVATPVVILIVMALLRRVVPANEVHIIQTKNTTTSYGKDKDSGNVYYEYPEWVPHFGMTVVVLPVSVFDCDLESYDAYDKGRVPFTLDVKAFFRIKDSNKAAQAVSSFQELHTQLQSILQGAVRTILASEEIETILEGRSVFGERFTQEVEAQLIQWGVSTVKVIELMDIRDAEGSKVIHNIMEKKKSKIEMESRIEVANNKQAAEQAEIQAKREVDMTKQQAAQQVGIRQAEQEREVGIAKEQTAQQIALSSTETAEKQAAVQRVQTLRAAEIKRDASVVAAEEVARTQVVVAEGQLKSEKLAAEGVKVAGEAAADAERAMQLAPVQAQIVLAKEIGENEGYQSYLIRLKEVEVSQVIGVAQAEAYKSADLKIIATAGNASEGLSSLGEIFSSTGGTKVGSMLEGMANTPMGAALLSKLLPSAKVAE